MGFLIIFFFKNLFSNHFIHTEDIFVAGVGGSASAEPGEDTWSAKYSCAIGDDTFAVTITREYMLISGFSRDETKAALEAWADTIPALGGQSA